MEQLDNVILNRFIRSLEDRFSVELLKAVAEMQIDAESQARYDHLADGHTEGALTKEETDELESFVHSATIFGLMKAEAQARLRIKHG